MHFSEKLGQRLSLLLTSLLDFKHAAIKVAEANTNQDSPESALQPPKENSQLASPHSVPPPAVHTGGASLKVGSVSSREGNRFTQEQLELFEHRYMKGTTYTSIRIMFDGLSCTTLIHYLLIGIHLVPHSQSQVSLLH